MGRRAPLALFDHKIQPREPSQISAADHVHMAGFVLGESPDDIVGTFLSPNFHDTQPTLFLSLRVIEAPLARLAAGFLLSADPFGLGRLMLDGVLWALSILSAARSPDIPGGLLWCFVQPETFTTMRFDYSH